MTDTVTRLSHSMIKYLELKLVCRYGPFFIPHLVNIPRNVTFLELVYSDKEPWNVKVSSIPHIKN